MLVKGAETIFLSFSEKLKFHLVLALVLTEENNMLKYW